MPCLVRYSRLSRGTFDMQPPNTALKYQQLEHGAWPVAILPTSVSLTDGIHQLKKFLYYFAAECADSLVIGVTQAHPRRGPNA